MYLKCAKFAKRTNVEDLEKFVNLNLSKLPEFSNKSYTLEQDKMEKNIIQKLTCGYICLYI